MKKNKWYLAGLLFLCCFSLAGCSSDDDGTDEFVSDLIGRWEMVGSSLSVPTPSPILNILPDGSYTFIANGDTLRGNYSVYQEDGDILTPDAKERLPYKYCVKTSDAMPWGVVVRDNMMYISTPSSVFAYMLVSYSFKKIKMEQ